VRCSSGLVEYARRARNDTYHVTSPE